MGQFRILNTDCLTLEWGKYKKNSGMTFEKICRSFRMYQKEGIMTKLERNQKQYRFNFEYITVFLGIKGTNF